MSQQYYSLAEAAQKLGVSTDELNRLRESGQVSAFHDDGNWMFREEDLSVARDALGGGSAAVLSDTLDIPSDQNQMGTVLGSMDSISRNDKVDIATSHPAGAGDSSIYGAIGPRSMTPGNSRTFVGNISPEEPVSLLPGATGKVKVETGSVLDGMLENPGDNPTATVLGSVDQGGSQRIRLDTGSQVGQAAPKADSNESAFVLDGDLDVDPNQSTGTVLGTKKDQPAEPPKPEVEIQTDDDAEQIFLSDRALGRDEPGSSRTVIGLPTPGMMDTSESDIHLVVRSDSESAEDIRIASPPPRPTPMAKGTEVKLVPSAAEPDDSDVKLTPSGRGATEETISLGRAADLAIDDDSMSIDLGDTDVKRRDSEELTDGTVTANVGDEDVTLDLGMGGSSVMDGDEDLMLGADAGGSDITISSQSGMGPLGAADSGLSLESPLDLASSGSKVTGSDVHLETEEDDEFVLSSTSGSDITRRPGESGIGIGAGESGIALASLADSGISLETPLDLGSGMGASGIGAGGDFLLTPVDEGEGEESDDSGSQVIALDSEGIDDTGATMLGPESEPLPSRPMLGPDYGQPAAAMAPAMGAGAYAAQQMRQPAMAPAPGLMPVPGGMMAPQAVTIPFTGLQVTALTFCVIFLVLGGLMTYDLMINIWSWEGANETISSPIMDKLLDLIEPRR